MNQTITLKRDRRGNWTVNGYLSPYLSCGCGLPLCTVPADVAVDTAQRLIDAACLTDPAIARVVVAFVEGGSSNSDFNFKVLQ